jgi:hypothetical protein
MKIVCQKCKRVLGVQSPYNDESEIPAKCPECFDKEKEAASKPQPVPNPGERVDIEFDGGYKGYLTVAGYGTEKLSFSDIIVSGKKISCSKSQRDQFIDYLEMIEKDSVEVTYLFSTSIIMPPAERRKSKKTVEPKKNIAQSVNYNCTVALPKYHVVAMFDNVAERMEKILNVICKCIVKAEKPDRKSA